MAKFLETFLVIMFTGIFLFTSYTSCSRFHSISNPVNTLISKTQKYYRSIVLIETTAGSKSWEKWSATAWAFDKNHLLTAGHFCESVSDGVKLGKTSPKVTIIGSNNKGMSLDLGQATVLAYIFNKDKDICILDMPSHHIPPLKITSQIDIVETEDPVTMIGAPDGKYPLRRDGYVWAITPRFLYIAIEAQGGNSGSPVIWNNEVIGMLIQVINRLNESAIAIKSDNILDFIEKYVK